MMPYAHTANPEADAGADVCGYRPESCVTCISYTSVMLFVHCLALPYDSEPLPAHPSLACAAVSCIHQLML